MADHRDILTVASLPGTLIGTALPIYTPTATSPTLTPTATLPIYTSNAMLPTLTPTARLPTITTLPMTEEQIIHYNNKSIIKNMNLYIELVRNLPKIRHISLVTDVQNMIINYISGSIPQYKQWATEIFDNTIFDMINDDKKDIYHRDAIINHITQIMVNNYTPNIGSILEEITIEDNNIRKINQNIFKDIQGLLSIATIHHDRSDYSIEELDDINLYKNLNRLWFDYQSPFIEMVFNDDALICYLNDVYINFIDDFVSNVEDAWSRDLDPFEKDPIVGVSFITWAINHKFQFEDAENRNKFQFLLLEMLETVDLNVRIPIGNRNKKKSTVFDQIETQLQIKDQDEILPLFIVMKCLDRDGNYLGWSHEFVLEIMTRTNIKQLRKDERQSLLTNILFFPSESIKTKFLAYINFL